MGHEVVRAARTGRRPGVPLLGTALVIAGLVVARGAFARLFTPSADTGERKDAEQRRVAGEQHDRLAAGQGHVWEWAAADGRIRVAPEFWSQLGIDPPHVEHVIAAIEALIHPDDAERGWRILRARLDRRLPCDVELRVRHANGAWRWLRVQGRATWDDEGRPTYMAGTSIDVTDRKRAEESLSEAEAYRRNVFDQLGDGVFLIDRDQHFTDANLHALAMLGYDHDELLRLKASDVMPDFERSRVVREILAVMHGQSHFARWHLRRKDGREIPVEVSARFLDERHLVAVVRDISARLEAEQALQDSRHELSDLTRALMVQERTTLKRIAQALHDHVGQTLGAARLNVDVLMARIGSTAPDALRDHGGQVALLLDQAIAEVRNVLVDLRPALLEMHGLSTALATEIDSLVIASRDVDVLLEVDEGTSALRWPPEVEYSAFMVAREAIANAQQHAEASLVRVLLDGDARSMHLQVIDDGRGIPTPVVHGRVGHLGIVGMRERAITVNAAFDVRRGAHGGTQVGFRWQEPAP